MKTYFSPKNNPRVIIIQKLYGKFFNEDENLSFPKHRFKKFIKDVNTKKFPTPSNIVEIKDEEFEKFLNKIG